MRVLKPVGSLGRPAVCGRSSIEGKPPTIASHATCATTVVGLRIATLLAHAPDAIRGDGSATAVLMREAYGWTLQNPVRRISTTSPSPPCQWPSP
jgi:hypothetical protein